MVAITKFRSVQINPGNLWVGDGDPDTALAGGDVHIEGTLEVDGALNLDGALALGNTLTVGVDGTGYDVKFFGDTSGSYLQWDESADKLILAYSKATIGLAQGSTGVALSGTDPDQVFQVHGYISAAVAAGAYAGAYVTNTVTATQTNDVSIFGTWSELYVTGGTVSLKSNHAAVWGNLEISGTVTLPGGIGWHGGVTGTVISPSTLTVSSGGILAGLIADSQVTAGYSATGAYICGLAIRAGTSKPWPIGIYIAPSGVTQAIQIGTLSSSTAGSGVSV
ncbi:MAG TPA: hypothetical protein VM487_09065, partial [Phycisphaerae bacterium]|nr:hypothetical protein [Phycisphaerae bacterium]